MRLFNSHFTTSDSANAADLHQHQLIAAVLGASPVPLTEIAKDMGFDAPAAQAYLSGETSGDVELIERLRQAARLDETGAPVGPYIFTPTTASQANDIWQLTRAATAADEFAFEVVAGGQSEACRYEHHVFAYRDRGGHTSFVYVPRHGGVDIWHETQAISADNFDLLHSMLNDLTTNTGGHKELLLVMHEWLQSARAVWRSYLEAMHLTAGRSSTTA